MKIRLRILAFFLFASLTSSCDSNRLFEVNNTFKNKHWESDSIQMFEFEIEEKTIAYNILFNIRNSSDFPYNNIYVKYSLEDTLNNIIEEQLVNYDLFDSKTGKPLGQSGIGDLFDHQFLLLDNYSFERSGKYIFKVQQYMRVDTLSGVLAAGFRVEKNDIGN